MDYSFVIITGMSGAGKSTAVNALEDIGYFCIDNMPTSLILKLFELTDEFFTRKKKVACVVDIRNGEDFTRLIKVTEALSRSGICKILYLDANNSVLIDRYKETRRIHPLTLQKDVSLENAIIREREVLTPLYERADYIIDTSLLSTAQLKERLLSIMLSNKKDTITIDVMSFGFKYGLPSDADIVFDVRCLLNPYYVPELKTLTGNDDAVREYVFSSENSNQLFSLQRNLLDYSLPLYINEGKSHLTIAYGCTGGRHRSVALANAMFRHLATQGYLVNIHHRDIER